MKKGLFCVALVLCVLVSFIACAETIQVGPASLLLPSGFELDNSLTEELGIDTYSDDDGYFIAVKLLDKKDKDLAYYKNSAGLLGVISELITNSFKNANLAQADECAAIRESSGNRENIIIIDRYDLIAVYVVSDSAEHASKIADDLLLFVTIKETPLK